MSQYTGGSVQRWVSIEMGQYTGGSIHWWASTDLGHYTGGSVQSWVGPWKFLGSCSCPHRLALLEVLAVLWAAWFVLIDTAAASLADDRQHRTAMAVICCLWAQLCS